jgi:hypothetical protein
MIKSIEFKNFRVLRDATLPLDRFTLIVGPNGSGKSTALELLRVAAGPGNIAFEDLIWTGEDAGEAQVTLAWEGSYEGAFLRLVWKRGSGGRAHYGGAAAGAPDIAEAVAADIQAVRVYSLDAHAIARPVSITPGAELEDNGGNLAAVLDRMRDEDPERFEALNEELAHWFPEYDRVLFDTTGPGVKAVPFAPRQEGTRFRRDSFLRGLSSPWQSSLWPILGIHRRSPASRSRIVPFTRDCCATSRRLSTDWHFPRTSESNARQSR